MININTELFKRYAPAKKIEIINALTEDELNAVKTETIIRIIKEAGKNKYRSREKRLGILSDRRVGNVWNSIVEAVEMFHNKPYIEFYVQLDDTDTNIMGEWENFIKSGNYRGKCYETNRYGDKVPHYFEYNSKHKAEVVKSILLEYVYTKYADKLK